MFLQCMNRTGNFVISGTEKTNASPVMTYATWPWYQRAFGELNETVSQVAYHHVSPCIAVRACQNTCPTGYWYSRCNRGLSGILAEAHDQYGPGPRGWCFRRVNLLPLVDYLSNNVFFLSSILLLCAAWHLAWWDWMSYIYEFWLLRRIIPRRRSMLGKVCRTLHASVLLSWTLQ